MVITSVLALLIGQSCRQSSKPSAGITITLIDQSWVDKQSQALLNEELHQFTKQTGMRVEVLPAPEAAVEQLATWRGLLESGASVVRSQNQIRDAERRPAMVKVAVRDGFGWA